MNIIIKILSLSCTYVLFLLRLLLLFAFNKTFYRSFWSRRKKRTVSYRNAQPVISAIRIFEVDVFTVVVVVRRRLPFCCCFHLRCVVVVVVVLYFFFLLKFVNFFPFCFTRLNSEVIYFLHRNPKQKNVKNCLYKGFFFFQRMKKRRKKKISPYKNKSLSEEEEEE